GRLKRGGDRLRALYIREELRVRGAFAHSERALPGADEVLRRHGVAVRPQRVRAQVKSPAQALAVRLPTARDCGHGPQSPRLVIRQPLEERAHRVRVWRRCRARGVEDLRQPAVAPAELLRAGHDHLAVKLFAAVAALKTTADDERKDDDQREPNSQCETWADFLP